MKNQNSSSQIQTFLQSPSFGVVGASNDRTKFGNRILRKYLQHQLKAYPIHPSETEVEGLPCLKSVKDLPSETQSISIITPPAVTQKVVEESIAKGIRNIWMQPGAESAKAVSRCREAGINVIADGSCLLVELK